MRAPDIFKASLTLGPPKGTLAFWGEEKVFRPMERTRLRGIDIFGKPSLPLGPPKGTLAFWGEEKVFRPMEEARLRDCDIFGKLSTMEQVKGIEPSYSAWEADVLPLNYTCMAQGLKIITPSREDCKHKIPGVS